MPTIDTSQCHPVVCLSASRFTSGGSSERQGSFNYVPGSGDDHEGWAPEGFSPADFWTHKIRILQASRSDLPSVVARIIAEAAGTRGRSANAIQRIGQTPIAIGIPFSGSVCEPEGCISIVAEQEEQILPQQSSLPRDRPIIVAVPQAVKKHHSRFRAEMDKVDTHVDKRLLAGLPVTIVAAEDTANNRDFGVAIALVLLCELRT